MRKAANLPEVPTQDQSIALPRLLARDVEDMAVAAVIDVAVVVAITVVEVIMTATVLTMAVRPNVTVEDTKIVVGAIEWNLSQKKRRNRLKRQR